MPPKRAIIVRIREGLHSDAAKVVFLSAAAAALVAIICSIALRAAAKSYFSSIRGEKALAAGIELTDAGNFAAAIRKLDAALRENLNPRQRAYALGERGWCYTKRRRDPDAIRDFDAALAINPSLFFALLDRGLAFHRQGRFDQAMNDYTKAIRLNRNALDAYQNRALIFAQRGQFKEAVDDINEAIRCAPNDPSWYVRRAHFFVAMGEPAAALASFESAIRLDPENVEGQYGRARVLSLSGEGARARADLEEYLRQRPASAQLFFVRALIDSDADELNGGVEDCAKAIKLRKDFAEPYAVRSVLEFRLGDFEAALAFARLATELNPRMPLPFQVRGRVLDSRLDFGAAVREFDHAVALDSGYVVARAWGALAEAHAGAYALAQRQFEEITKTFPTDSEGHRLRGWFLATCPDSSFRDGPRAVSEAQLAVKLSNDDADALDVLAVPFAEESNFPRAIEFEEKALDKTPSNSSDCRRFNRRLFDFKRGISYRDTFDL